MVIISHVVFVILPAQNAWNQRTLKVKLLLNPSGGGGFFHNCIHNLKIISWGLYRKNKGYAHLMECQIKCLLYMCVCGSIQACVLIPPATQMSYGRCIFHTRVCVSARVIVCC